MCESLGRFYGALRGSAGFRSRILRAKRWQLGRCPSTVRPVLFPWWSFGYAVNPYPLYIKEGGGSPPQLRGWGLKKHYKTSGFGQATPFIKGEEGMGHQGKQAP